MRRLGLAFLVGLGICDGAKTGQAGPNVQSSRLISKPYGIREKHQYANITINDKSPADPSLRGFFIGLRA